MKKAFLVVLFLFVSLCCGAESSPEQLRQNVKNALKDGIVRDAVYLAEKSISDYPAYYMGYVTYSEALYFNQEFAKAVYVCEGVLKMGKKTVGQDVYAKAHLMLAANRAMVVHFGSYWTKILYGRNILPHLKIAEKILSDDPEVLLGLGAFYLFSPKLVGGNLNKAGEYFHKAVEKNPLFADAYVRLAQYYQRKGEAEKAVEMMDQALVLEPKNILAHDIKSGACRFICAKDLTE